MKKVLLVVIAGLLNCTSFSQVKPDKNDTNVYERDFMAISLKQKKIASIMLAGGVALVVAPTLIVLSSDLSDNSLDSKYILAMGVITVGGLSVLGSIPVFIAAARNKGRALSGSVGLKMDQHHYIYGKISGFRSYPALSVKLNL